MSLSHSAKRDLLTWALLLFFLALLAIILVLQWQTKCENLVLSRTAQSVSRIVIERKDHPTIVLEKEDQWWITSPLRMPANDQRITPLLTVYTNPDLGYPIDSVDLMATGLQDPDVNLYFNDYRVSIGNQAIDEAKRHALHGDRIRFVPDWVLPLLQGGISAVADLTVFGNELNAITLSSGDSIDDAALGNAKTLTAQQFVQWPRPEPPEISSQHEVSVNVSGVNTPWVMFKTERYIAMLPDNANYAYVVPLSDAPWLNE